MSAIEHLESSHNLHHIREIQHDKHHEWHSHTNLQELYGALPESSPYRHLHVSQSDHQSIILISPYEHTSNHEGRNAEHTRSSKAVHERLLTAAEIRIEKHLRHNPNDFSPVYRELDRLRHSDGASIERDLKEINSLMHKRGLLNGQELVRDDRSSGDGWAVIAYDKQNPQRDGHQFKTMVSTSHAPQESDALRRQYSHMRYRRGHYDGWRQSVEGGGGDDGGFDSQAVGGHVPPGARRELIEEALRLAGVPVTDRNISAVNTIVTRESSWNPNITNNWDSNARAGHPSTGLMQTIPSTFRQYALPGLDSNIHDPLSNLVAGIRYAENRYGVNGISGVARVASRQGGY